MAAREYSLDSSPILPLSQRRFGLQKVFSTRKSAGLWAEMQRGTMASSPAPLLSREKETAVSDDDELFTQRRPRKKSPASDSSSTAKTLLMAFGILAVVGVIACCGVIGAVYYIWQKNFSQIALTQPADIQKLTAEMTDIAIPTQFVPKFGNSILGIKTVVYQWCPTGTCPPDMDQEGTLSLTSFQMPTNGDPNAGVSLSSDDQFTEEVLQQTWFEHAHSELEVDIRGKKCKFHIVRGEELDYSSMMHEIDEEVEVDSAVVETTNPVGETPANPSPSAPERKGSGKKIVQVSGSFPGKAAEVNLSLRLDQADYQEEMIHSMLKSIH